MRSTCSARPPSSVWWVGCCVVLDVNKKTVACLRQSFLLYCITLVWNLVDLVSKLVGKFFAHAGKMCWPSLKNLGPSQKTLRPPWCPKLVSSMLARGLSETEFWIDQHYNNFILSLRCGQIGHATESRDWTEFYQFGLPCDIYSGMLKWLLTFRRIHKVNLKAIRPPPGCQACGARLPNPQTVFVFQAARGPRGCLSGPQFNKLGKFLLQ